MAAGRAPTAIFKKELPAVPAPAPKRGLGLSAKTRKAIKIREKIVMED
jgi:hypothetical protein